MEGEEGKIFMEMIVPLCPWQILRLAAIASQLSFQHGIQLVRKVVEHAADVIENADCALGFCGGTEGKGP